ncbi:MAG: rhomboid family intramembrane serine protease [Acidobacteriota bacterium]
MFKRQTTGSVVCASCGYLVGVKDETCYHCGRRNPGLWGFAPALRSLGQDLGFVPFVIGMCVLVFALTLLATGGLSMSGGLLLAPSSYALIVYGASGAIPVFELNRWWTVLSAGWLHGSILHLIMNIWGVRVLGPIVADLYGPGRLVIIYTVATITGFLVSSVAGYSLAFLPFNLHFGAPLTVGASAAIFGLIGSVMFYGHRTGARHISSQAWSWAIPTIILGLVFPGIDNAAHAGGFIGGYLASRVLDPLKPERVKHMFWAVCCLGLSMISIIVSVVTAMRLR